jgi:hypothetical protein
MASTRNKNTAGDYRLHTRENSKFVDSMLYENSAWGVQENTYLAGDGVAAPRVPYTQLSNNGVDIESFLRGTHSVDLENPTNSFVPIPDLRRPKTLCMYKKPDLVMPPPLVAETGMRPRILGL